MIGVDEGAGPHSSRNAPFAGSCDAYQQVVAIDPSDKVSTRNLFSNRVNGSD